MVEAKLAVPRSGDAGYAEGGGGEGSVVVEGGAGRGRASMFARSLSVFFFPLQDLC